jgi:primosomal protein N' (replication factor Y)
MERATQYAEVAVSGPLRRTFTYRVPPAVAALEPGQRVLVPFGSARKVGFHLAAGEPKPNVYHKDVIRMIDDRSLLPKDVFRLCTWMADYYFANPADCLAAALPPVVKSTIRPAYTWSVRAAESGELPDWLVKSMKSGARVSPTVWKRLKTEHHSLWKKLRQTGCIVEDWPERGRSSQRPAGYRVLRTEDWNPTFARFKSKPRPFDGVRDRTELYSAGWSDHAIRRALRENLLEPVYDDGLETVLAYIQPRQDVRQIALTREQQDVLDQFGRQLVQGFSAVLLHGVTGSGKTIVYCHLADAVLRRGQAVLVLTPEIALAGTTLAYLRGFFGNAVTVIHSAMTDKERLESWNGVRHGRYRIVVGPRSAVFAPLPSLGLIIVDEEHDGAYKQDDPAPRFHGRDAAIMRARINNIPVLLGSASPSLESFYNAQSGKYRLLQLSQRPKGAALPRVHIVDMRSQRLRGDLPFFSYALKKQVEVRLAQGEQVILYLNRRGHSPLLKCAECGHVPRCPHCRVNLTYHRTGQKLTCHYCGFVDTQYHACAHCRSTDLLYLGAGTQKVEEAIPRLFDAARVARFDSDAVTGRATAYTILTDFARRKHNLLLGTQMVTKGLDLPEVTLVGVLSADHNLDLPDFRAAEKTFAQLLQVAGRSGRAANAGEVHIQTYYPDHDVINDAAAQDYHAFYTREIRLREQLRYPPFTHLINCLLSSRDEKKLEASALVFLDQLQDRVQTSRLRATLLGPAPCPLYYLRSRYRRHLLLKTGQPVRLVRMLTEWEAQQARFGLPSAVRVTVDVDPDDMM